MYWRAPQQKRTRSLQQRTALFLAAVLVGVYLGGSTVAQIDPFYRNAATRSGDSSYTANGWRGANATPPPSESAEIDYPTSSNPSPYEVARYVASSPFVRDSVVYVGGAIHDLVGEDPPARDAQADLNSGAGYDCVNCGEAARDEPAADSASAAPAACREGDWACFRDAPPPDDEPPPSSEAEDR